MVSADPTMMAGQFVGRQPYSDLIDQFRQLVAKRLGRLAVAIFDARLEGRDMKELVGTASIGAPSAFLGQRRLPLSNSNSLESQACLDCIH
jgi:hypothetical protein